MKPRVRLLNWAIVVIMALFFGGVLALGIVLGQQGQILFNGTIV